MAIQWDFHSRLQKQGHATAWFTADQIRTQFRNSTLNNNPDFEDEDGVISLTINGWPKSQHDNKPVMLEQLDLHITYQHETYTSATQASEALINLINNRIAASGWYARMMGISGVSVPDPPEEEEEEEEESPAPADFDEVARAQPYPFEGVPIPGGGRGD